MRILSIGTDERVFEKGSIARMRQEAYAKALGHVDLVVLTRREIAGEGGETLSLYSASSGRIRRLFRAHRIARSLERPKVVTVQDPFEVGFVGTLVARRFRVPLHVQVHADFLSPEFSRSLVGRVRVALAGYVLRRASRVRVVSERIRTSLQKQHELRVPITVLPIYTDVARLKEAKVPADLASQFSRFKTKVLVVSRQEKEKNVGLAIDAFAQAAPEDACLIVLGEGRERDNLEERAMKSTAGERIIFHGHADPAPYYALADLVLVPSQYEGYGLVVVEALAAHKPVLSTDVGVARESGAIVAEPEVFAEALAQWFKSGPRTAILQNYPYASFEQYVAAYAADIAACAAPANRQ